MPWSRNAPCCSSRVYASPWSTWSRRAISICTATCSPYSAGRIRRLHLIRRRFTPSHAVTGRSGKSLNSKSGPTRSQSASLSPIYPSGCRTICTSRSTSKGATKKPVASFAFLSGSMHRRIQYFNGRECLRIAFSVERQADQDRVGLTFGNGSFGSETTPLSSRPTWAGSWNKSRLNHVPDRLPYLVRRRMLLQPDHAPATPKP